MKYFKDPKHFERNVDENFVIGYHNGKAIVRNALGEFGFIVCEECHAPEGSVVPNDEFAPISFLSADEQHEIISIYDV